MGCLKKSVGAVLSVLVAALLSPPKAFAVPITHAPALETAYGDGFLGTEILVGRYQQVYSAPPFGSGEVLSITGIRLRPFVSQPFTVLASAIDIVLSTTPAAASGLSSVFADNLGADPTVVFSGPALLASGGRSGDPGADFDVVLPLNQPFVYDPAAGNLLLDLRASAGLGATVGAVQFDSWHANELVEVSSLLAFDSNALSGNVFPVGLATRFDVESLGVPEPGTGLLFAAGLVLLMAPARGLLGKRTGLPRTCLAREPLRSSCRLDDASGEG